MSHATVYLITNTTNGNTYVGVTRFAAEKRWREHCYTAKREPKTRLHRAIAKYGVEAFTVEPVATVMHADDAAGVEREVIMSLSPVYNQTNGGEIVIGRRVTREVAERIRAANTGKKRTDAQKRANGELKKRYWAEHPEARGEILAALARGRANVSEERRLAAVRAAALAGKLGRPLTPERLAIQLTNLNTPEARSKAAASKRKPVECVTLNATFDSLLDAAEATGIDFGTISSVCLGKRKHTHGLVFQYVRS